MNELIEKARIKRDNIFNSIIDGDVGENIVNSVGDNDGKYSAAVSQSSHILNVLSVGITSYVYDKIVIENSTIDNREIELLIAGLILHDTNKNFNEDKNTSKVLKMYVENDKFGLNEALNEVNLEDDLEQILYLVQRTEKSENGAESRGNRPKYPGLEAYCELADSSVSSFEVDGFNQGRDKLLNHYNEDEIHTVELQDIELSLCNMFIIKCVQNVIQEKYGLVIGSDINKIIYLGEEYDNDVLVSEVTKQAEDLLSDAYMEVASPKVQWNTYKYQSLPDFPVSVDKKRELISKKTRSILERDVASSPAVEKISEEFFDLIPELNKIIYQPDDGSAMSESYEEIFTKNEKLEDLYNKVDEEASSSHSFRVHLLSQCCIDYDEIEDEIKTITDKVTEDVKSDLTPEKNVLKQIVSVTLGNSKKFSRSDSNDDCFLCGRNAYTVYEPGNTSIYGTDEFSRTPGVGEETKYICSYCQLETELLKYHANVKDSMDSFEGTILVVYFDSFISDILMSYPDKNDSLNIGTNIFSDLDGTIAPESINSLGELAKLPYRIHPVDHGLNNTTSDGKNSRMKLVYETLSLIKKSGVKAEIRMSVSNFEPDRDKVFNDTVPIRLEEILGIDTITSYEDLHRPLLLFELLDSVEDAKFIDLDYDGFTHLASVVDNNCDRKYQEVENLFIEYAKKYHTKKYNMMDEIAKTGIEIYGRTFDSKHSRTTVFREAIEAFLKGINRDLQDQELEQFVSGQVYSTAQRQSNYVEIEDVSKFVSLIHQYLSDNELLNIKNLSDARNELVDTYDFCYLNAAKSD